MPGLGCLLPTWTSFGSVSPTSPNPPSQTSSPTVPNLLVRSFLLIWQCFCHDFRTVPASTPSLLSSLALSHQFVSRQTAFLLSTHFQWGFLSLTITLVDRPFMLKNFVDPMVDCKCFDQSFAASLILPFQLFLVHSPSNLRRLRLNLLSKSSDAFIRGSPW